MKITSSRGSWKRGALLAALLGVGGLVAGRSFDTLTSAASADEFALLAQDGSPSSDEGNEDRPPPPPRQGRPDGPPPPPPLMVALDKDRDGELSAEEIAGAAETLKSLDKDGDSKLSHEEMRPEPPPGAPRGGRRDGPPPPREPQDADRDGARRPGARDDGPPPPRRDDAPPPRRGRGEGPPPPFGFDGRRPVPPLFKALDKDKDGELSAKEIAAAAESLKSLDEDGDGVLSHEEMRPAPPDGPPPGRRPQQGARKATTSAGGS